MPFYILILSFPFPLYILSFFTPNLVFFTFPNLPLLIMPFYILILSSFPSLFYIFRFFTPISSFFYFPKPPPSTKSFLHLNYPFPCPLLHFIVFTPNLFFTFQTSPFNKWLYILILSFFSSLFCILSFLLHQIFFFTFPNLLP